MPGLKRLLFSTLISVALSPTSVFAQGLSDQKFFCNVGYTQKACSEQMAVLRRVLAKYHAERLGSWTWVLVRSADWRDIAAPRGLNTLSPAFTYLEKRKTFFEEALFTTVPGRNAELLRYWSLPADQLLDLAITHELGHSICGDPDEQRADSFGKLERAGAHPDCARQPLSQSSVEPGKAGTVTNATPQTASFIDITTQSFVELPPQEWHAQIIVRIHNYPHVDDELLLRAEPLFSQSDSVAVLAGTQPVFNPSIEIPIQLCRDYLVIVEGSIGTLEKLTFIIDTGTYPSIVDRRIATALGLSESDGKVALVNQSVQAKLATLPFVRIGPARAESVPVLVQDLSSLEKTLGRRIDAIVGLDVLGKNSFSINYRTKRLRFGAVERSQSTVSFETNQPLITVEARLHDRPVRLLVDTGAANLLLFQSRLKDPLSQAGKAIGATNVGGGNFQLQPVLIPDMRMGKEELGPQTGFVVADRRDEGYDFDGLLSIRSLHLEEIGFDFENHKISWKK